MLSIAVPSVNPLQVAFVVVAVTKGEGLTIIFCVDELEHPFKSV